MNIALWVIAGLLAVAYFFAGFMKATQPIESLSKTMGWTREIPVPLVRFIGIAEALGAIGLIVPLATGILPWLTPAAAVGLVVVQMFAVIFHVSRREATKVPTNVILLVLAAFIAYGRVAL